MTTEDYVSFETAKLLKEKGFDWEVHRSYLVNDNCFAPSDVNDLPNRKDAIRIPTLQMVMKWLREVHSIIIIPNVRVSDPITGIIDCYCVGVWYIPKNNGNALSFTSPTPYEGYSSYEEAAEAAIKYCLENLI